MPLSRKCPIPSSYTCRLGMHRPLSIQVICAIKPILARNSRRHNPNSLSTTRTRNWHGRLCGWPQGGVKKSKSMSLSLSTSEGALVEDITPSISSSSYSATCSWTWSFLCGHIRCALFSPRLDSQCRASPTDVLQSKYFVFVIFRKKT